MRAPPRLRLFAGQPSSLPYLPSLPPFVLSISFTVPISFRVLSKSSLLSLLSSLPPVLPESSLRLMAVVVAALPRSLLLPPQLGEFRKNFYTLSSLMRRCCRTPCSCTWWVRLRCFWTKTTTFSTWTWLCASQSLREHMCLVFECLWKDVTCIVRQSVQNILKIVYFLKFYYFTCNISAHFSYFCLNLGSLNMIICFHSCNVHIYVGSMIKSASSLLCWNHLFIDAITKILYFSRNKKGSTFIRIIFL